MSSSSRWSTIQSRQPTFENKKCWCGLRAVVHISESSENPGRLYYRCPKDNKDKEKCGYWKWCYQIGCHEPNPHVAPEVKLVNNDAHVEVVEVTVANLKHKLIVCQFLSGLALVVAIIALLK
ncbi:hypothetical protein RHMOL_Rhmol01G0204300 [Rhododendron molle]|uniref:Uncharacterized protein n=1 Tax=Rhododendron molle TaxID=49168 RepID=A0ACC0Q687_RHOML|nr:hypothetical protein RHMOL_Rhmol01G0204300 [Rhododendron molle]